MTSILNKIRPPDPDSAAPKAPMELPDGKWIGLDYPSRIPPLTRR